MAKKRKKKKSNSKKINNWGALFLLLLVTYSIWWLIKQAQQPQNPQQLFTNSLCHVKDAEMALSLIHISEPTRQAEISYAVFCLKKKKKKKQNSMSRNV